MSLHGPLNRSHIVRPHLRHSLLSLALSLAVFACQPSFGQTASITPNYRDTELSTIVEAVDPAGARRDSGRIAADRIAAGRIAVARIAADRTAEGEPRLDTTHLRFVDAVLVEEEVVGVELLVLPEPIERSIERVGAALRRGDPAHPPP